MQPSYEDQLFANTKALTWLSDRALMMPTIERARIGYVGTPLPGHEPWQGWLSLPYCNPDGSIRQYRFRRLDGGEPRYLQPQGNKTHLYQVGNVDEATVFITEGEFDALILGQTGRAAVGLPGATQWKSAWRFLFANCERVVVVADGDEAGRQAAWKIGSSLRDITNTEIVSLPDGEDVNSLYLRDRAGLERLLA